MEKNHIILVNKLSDKNLSEHEIGLQDFIITSPENTKLTSITYEISKRKRKGLGYNEKCAKVQLIESSDTSCNAIYFN